jgi:hypothetical protein
MAFRSVVRANFGLSLKTTIPLKLTLIMFLPRMRHQFNLKKKQKICITESNINLPRKKLSGKDTHHKSTSISVAFYASKSFIAIEIIT